jgi:hypothetical protein
MASSSSSGGGIRGGSSGSAYSGGGLSGMGSAMNAPIGGLGMVPGTAMYSRGGGLGGSPTYGGGYIGNVGDSRTFSALSPLSQEYMRAGSPGNNYARWLQGGGGGAVPGVAPGVAGGDALQQMLAMMFAQQQRRADYSQLFTGTLESPGMSAPTQPTPAFSNRPSFGNINPYA